MARPEPRWTPPPEPDRREPQTPLGRRLEQIRAEIVAANTPLLSWADLEREVSAAAMAS